VDALFVTVDGGGNLPAALAIARQIRRSGGTARFLGHEPQRAAIEAAGFGFETYRRGRAYDASQPRSTISGLRDLSAVFADRAIGEDAADDARTTPTDVLIVDCLLVGALDRLMGSGISTVSLVHTLWSYFDKQTRGPLGAVLRLRGVRMRAALQSPGLSLVTTRADFEAMPAKPTPRGVEHVGVVWQGTPHAARPATGPPRVLVSLSTSHFPGQEAAMQAILDGLADLEVEIVVTTGPAIDQTWLRVPANATVHRHLDHAQVMGEASLVIGHGGHSTASRALSYGVPMLVMPMHPMMGQSAVGEAVVRHGAGRMLPKSAKPAAIRAAVTDLLTDGSFRVAAARLGESVRQQDGAVVAVDHLESFIGRRPNG
jgi:UDP:flavonoid glycosyltransferase YjiC (YdhE family)